MKSLLLTLVLSTSFAYAETVHEISRPTESSSGSLLSSESSPFGVCKFLGFDRALRGSVKSIVDYYIYYGPNEVVPVYLRDHGIVIDEEGRLEGSYYGRVIQSIKCIRD